MSRVNSVLFVESRRRKELFSECLESTLFCLLSLGEGGVIE